MFGGLPARISRSKNSVFQKEIQGYDKGKPGSVEANKANAAGGITRGKYNNKI